MTTHHTSGANTGRATIRWRCGQETSFADVADGTDGSAITWALVDCPTCLALRSRPDLADSTAVEEWLSS